MRIITSEAYKYSANINITYLANLCIWFHVLIFSRWVSKVPSLAQWVQKVKKLKFLEKLVKILHYFFKKELRQSWQQLGSFLKPCLALLPYSDWIFSVRSYCKSHNLTWIYGKFTHTIRKKVAKTCRGLRRGTYKKRWWYIYIQVTLWQVVMFCCRAFIMNGTILMGLVPENQGFWKLH